MPIDPSAADIHDAVHAVSPEMQRVIASVTAKAQADPIRTAHEHLRHLVGAIELSDEEFLKRGEHVRILTYEARAVADVLETKVRAEAAPNDALLAVARRILTACDSGDARRSFYTDGRAVPAGCTLTPADIYALRAAVALATP